MLLLPGFPVGLCGYLPSIKFYHRTAGRFKYIFHQGTAGRFRRSVRRKKGTIRVVPIVPIGFPTVYFFFVFLLFLIH